MIQADIDYYAEEMDKWKDCEECRDKVFMVSKMKCPHCFKNCIFIIPPNGPIWALLSIVNKKGLPLMHSCKEGMRNDRETTGYDFQYIMSYLAHNP